MKYFLILLLSLMPLVCCPMNQSLRLSGMGNLNLAVEDELNELNFYDFGGNPAGIIENDSNKSLVKAKGTYTDYKQKWEYTEREWRNFSTYGSIETAYRNKNLGLAINPSHRYIYKYSRKDDYYYNKDNAGYPALDIAGACKPKWFTVGAGLQNNRTYLKQEDSTSYEKTDDTKNTYAGIIFNPLSVMKGKLCVGITGGYWTEQMDTVTDENFGMQAIYNLEDKLKIGIRTNIEKNITYNRDSSLEVSSATELKGIYTIGNGENRVNLGCQMDFNTSDTYNKNDTTKTILTGFGTGLFYSNSGKYGIGIEFIVNNKTYECIPYPEDGDLVQKNYYIRTGGEINFKKYLYLRGGYCLNFIDAAHANLWYRTGRTSETYTAGIGIKLLNMKLDAAYNFDEGFFSLFYNKINLKIPAVGVAATIYL